MLDTERPTHILWDNDGVLVDTERLYFQATRETLAGVGVELTREQYIDISLTRGESAFDLAVGRTPAEVDALRASRNVLYTELLRDTDLTIDGVRDTLARLHGHLGMGVVTSSLREHFDVIHAGTGILEYFDFILAREDFEKTKPDPEPYETALRVNDLDASDCVVIEDSARGMQSAVAAGLRCIVIPTDLTEESDLSAAWRILDDVRDVPEALGLRVDL